MARDIDYAATAVKKALVEKFGGKNDLWALDVQAGERTIIVRDSHGSAEGTRDALLAAIRGADSYDDLWQRWKAG